MLLTLEQAKEIVERNEAFISKTEEINGAKVTQFNYLLASASDFVKPLPDKDITAFDLRGLTYVETDVSVQCWPMLHKFFNVGETTGYETQTLKELSISHIQEKEDGSVINFIHINGSWFAKSKYSFFSDQAITSQKILDTKPNYLAFIEYLFNGLYVPIFEYVAPNNQVVVRYDKPQLRLLQIRDMITGQYMDVQTMSAIASQYSIYFTKPIQSETFDSLLEKREVLEDIEGWVIRFDNGLFAKLKTQWYIEKHRLITGEGMYANNIIQLILEEQIDDIRSALDEVDERRVMIDEIEHKINRYVNHLCREVETLIADYNKDNHREWAISNKDNPLFGVATRAIKYGVLDSVKEHVLKLSNKKEKAEKLLGSL